MSDTRAVAADEAHHDRVRVATPADRDTVVATVVAAFVADPAFRYFFPDDATYAPEAAAFAGHLFDHRVGLGTVWMAGGGHAVTMWVPPSTDRSASGSPTPPVSAAARTRLDRYDTAVHDALPPEPHWYLGIAATHPDHAGRRLGRALIDIGRARATAEGVASVLETTNADNVALYERSGWRVVAEVPGTPIQTWILRA